MPSSNTSELTERQQAAFLRFIEANVFVMDRGQQQRYIDGLKARFEGGTAINPDNFHVVANAVAEEPAHQELLAIYLRRAYDHALETPATHADASEKPPASRDRSS